jgi:glycosyltransferase involved in cell wall biosynthesis
MKISILCNDLAGRDLPRAYTLALSLQPNYDVEIIGPYFQGDDLFFPFRKPVENNVPYRGVTGHLNPLSIKTVRDLCRIADGDIVYAINPNLFTMGVGLLKQEKTEARFILDIDDSKEGLFKEDLARDGRIMYLKDLATPQGRWIGRILEYMKERPDGVTAVCSSLAEEYGADIIVPHAKDHNFLCPGNYDTAGIEEELGLTNKHIIMFLGSPGPHKGVRETLAAINECDNRDQIKYVVGGKTDNDYIRDLYDPHDKLKLLGEFTYYDLPKYLSMADSVVLHQHNTPAAAGQMPAKLFDALSMGVPVIGTNVSDLPDVIDGCGYIVQPHDISTLADRIDQLVANPEQAKRLGERGREKFIEKYSIKRMVSKFQPFIENVVEA